MGYPVKYLALLSFANVMFLFSRLILDFETSHDLRKDGFLQVKRHGIRLLVIDRTQRPPATQLVDSAGLLLFTGTTSASHALYRF